MKSTIKLNQKLTKSEKRVPIMSRKYITSMIAFKEYLNFQKMDDQKCNVNHNANTEEYQLSEKFLLQQRQKKKVNIFVDKIYGKIARQKHSLQSITDQNQKQLATMKTKIKGPSKETAWVQKELKQLNRKIKQQQTLTKKQIINFEGIEMNKQLSKNQLTWEQVRFHEQYSTSIHNQFKQIVLRENIHRSDQSSPTNLLDDVDNYQNKNQYFLLNKLSVPDLLLKQNEQCPKRFSIQDYSQPKNNYQKLSNKQIISQPSNEYTEDYFQLIRTLPIHSEPNQVDQFKFDLMQKPEYLFRAKKGSQIQNSHQLDINQQKESLTIKKAQNILSERKLKQHLFQKQIDHEKGYLGIQIKNPHIQHEEDDELDLQIQSIFSPKSKKSKSFPRQIKVQQISGFIKQGSSENINIPKISMFKDAYSPVSQRSIQSGRNLIFSTNKQLDNLQDKCETERQSFDKIIKKCGKSKFSIIKSFYLLQDEIQENL